MHLNGNSETYFDNFGVEYIPKKTKTLIDNKSIKANFFRMQAYDSIMCAYFFIGFIDFMCRCKSLVDFRYLFYQRDLKINDKIVLNYFLKIKY